jgi:hypothetical protein
MIAPDPAGAPARGAPPGDPPPSVVAAPFVVLALALVGTFSLSDTLAHALDGFISFKQFGPVLAWTFFVVFAAVFFWLDTLFVGMREDGAWPSVAAMWVTTAWSTVGATLISAVVGAVVAALTAAAKAYGLSFLELLLPGGAIVAAAVGIRSNVRTRRAMRIVPRAF